MYHTLWEWVCAGNLLSNIGVYVVPQLRPLTAYFFTYRFQRSVGPWIHCVHTHTHLKKRCKLLRVIDISYITMVHGHI
jgi:hypothetical protein